MQTFSVINLGCKVNRAESDSVELELESMGFEPAESNCDIIVVNTCTVTSIAEKKTRKTVRQALAAHPLAKVIVTGCAVAQDPAVYKKMSDRVDVVLKWDLQRYLQNMEPEVNHNVKKTLHIHNGAASDRYCRANVKVQDGCINECTYCIIHKLRGPEMSVAPAKVLQRVQQLEKNGIVEVILSGINLGRFDYEGKRLIDLCEILLENTSKCRFRLSSIEPNNITEEIIDCVENSSGRICRHFHLPLQAGCDRTLENMGRKYTAQEYLDVITAIRNKIPFAAISTDVICGFPGETEEDFKETVDFCKKVGFSKIHVFPYSLRKGTPAFDMDGQIDHAVKNERARELRDVAKQLREEDMIRRHGETETAVVEDENWCMTESYHRVAAPDGAVPGQLVKVVL